jgi:hypothetical protein
MFYVNELFLVLSISSKIVQAYNRHNKKTGYDGHCYKCL